MTLHDQIRAGAATLADAITRGDYAALTDAQRCEMRALTVVMLAWADDAHELEFPVVVLTEAGFNALKSQGSLA